MVSPEVMRDTDLMLKSKQSPIIISNRAVTDQPVKLTKKKTATILSRNSNQKTDKKCVVANNNILLLSRSDLDPSNKSLPSVINTISKSVILPQNNKISPHGGIQGREISPTLRIPKKRFSGATTPAVRKLSVRPGCRLVKLESKELEASPSTPSHVNKIQTSSVNLGKKLEPPQEPINLSLKPEDREKKIFLKVIDEKKLKYCQQDNTLVKAEPPSTPSARRELTIIPVINLTDSPEKDTLDIVREDESNDSREDIDDDEDSFLQKMGEEIGDMVQVKLECEEVDSEGPAKLTYSCPKCSRSYSKKSLCEIHMKKVHFSLRSKEKCNICGVRFINLQAHKEKYHYFVDVDRCHLCGKVVKYLSSHHCPLQKDLRLKEIKLECPKCGNLVKQKYLKIHQKNHCVGVSSTFSNFRTANQEQSDSQRIPLHLIGKSVLTPSLTGTEVCEAIKQRTEASEATIKQRKEIHLTPR